MPHLIPMKPDVIPGRPIPANQLRLRELNYARKAAAELAERNHITVSTTRMGKVAIALIEQSIRKGIARPGKGLRIHIGGAE